jgi:Ca-activated chloride channel family protein
MKTGTHGPSSIHTGMMALLLLLASPALLGARGPKEAAAHYRAERYLDAVVEYRRVIAAGDRSEETLYNLGTALLGADSLASAIEILERVAQSRSDEIRYRAGFNLGLAHLRQGLAAEGDAGAAALTAALAAYKNVLIMRSGDEDAKWNYELALREQENSGGGGGGGGEDDPSPSSAPDPSATPEAPAERPQGSLGQGQAEQILNAAERDERDVQEKRRERAQPPKARTGKDW